MRSVKKVEVPANLAEAIDWLRPADLLDLGYVAFYAIGAYGLALGYHYLGLGFWTVLPLSRFVRPTRNSRR